MAETDSEEDVRRAILEIERETMAAIERKDKEALAESSRMSSCTGIRRARSLGGRRF